MKRILTAMAGMMTALVVQAILIGWLFRFGSDRTIGGIKVFNKHILNPLMLRSAGAPTGRSTDRS